MWYGVCLSRAVGCCRRARRCEIGLASSVPGKDKPFPDTCPCLAAPACVHSCMLHACGLACVESAGATVPDNRCRASSSLHPTPSILFGESLFSHLCFLYPILEPLRTRTSTLHPRPYALTSSMTEAGPLLPHHTATQLQHTPICQACDLSLRAAAGHGAPLPALLRPAIRSSTTRTHTCTHTRKPPPRPAAQQEQDGSGQVD